MEIEPNIERVRAPDEPAFEEVWGALRDEFAPRGEIERREVVERWLSNPSGYGAAGVRVRYNLLAIRDDHGKLLAARDHHVIVDESHGIVTVYLAHALVMPAHRRKGLGLVLRNLPAEDARMAAMFAGLDAPDTLLAAEMEPFTPGSAESVVRLVAYGRGSFAAIDPAAILHQQPDFRGATRPKGPSSSIPLLAIVRRIGHEGAKTIPHRLAAAMVRHLHAVFATHCGAEDLAPIAALSLEALARASDPVPLLPLPTNPDDDSALAALERTPFELLYAAN